MRDPSAPRASDRHGLRADWSRDLRPRLASLRLSAAREAEIVEELSQHLDDRYEQLRAEGASADDARRLALEELDGQDALARRLGALRQSRVPPPLPDGPGAGRPRRRHPPRPALRGTDAAQAAGIRHRRRADAGAGHRRQHRGVQPRQRHALPAPAGTGPRAPGLPEPGDPGGVFSYPQYESLRDHAPSFEALAGWGGITASLHAGDSAELVSGFIVTGNFFDVLGIQPARGRLLSRIDDQTPGAHPVAVISYDFWQARFGGQPDVIGREVRLNGHVFTIVGVTPAGFPGPQVGSPRPLYVPMMMQAIMRPPRARYSGEQNPDLLKSPSNSWIFGVGRLKAGATDRAGRRRARPGDCRFLPHAPAAAAGRDSAAHRDRARGRGLRRAAAADAVGGAPARRRSGGGAADRLRERRESAAVAGRGAAAGARRAARARGQPRPPAPAAAHRERPARRHRRTRRHRAGLGNRSPRSARRRRPPARCLSPSTSRSIGGCCSSRCCSRARPACCSASRRRSARRGPCSFRP